MSHTDHYMDLTVEQIIQMLETLGRKPRRTAIPFKDGTGSWDVLYWNRLPEDPTRDNELPWGVDLTKYGKIPEGWLRINKGCFDCWNGQSLLSDLIEKHLGHKVEYTD